MGASTKPGDGVRNRGSGTRAALFRGPGDPAPACRRKRGRPAGFSLVELMIVIAIIGVLATVVIVRYAGKVDKAKVAAAKAQLMQIENAVDEFQANCSRYPASLDELVNRPADCPGWQEGGYLKNKKVPKDPWGNEYIYRLEGSQVEVVCLGADGKEGGSGVDKDLSTLSMGEEEK